MSGYLEEATKVPSGKFLGCHVLTDLDGDGLNSCEEIAVGTSDLDFDNDGDGVPDSIEIIMQTKSKLG